MSIINNYNMQMILDGSNKEMIKEILRDRSFALITIDRTKIEKSGWNRWYHDVFGLLDSFYHLAIREKHSDIPDKECDLYLNLSMHRNKKGDDYNREGMKEAANKPGITITYPDEKEIMEIINGKELVFRVYFAEEAGNVEWTIQRKLLENIFLKDDEEMNLLYDDHYDVKVFLQRQANVTPNETGLQPADIRRFDIGQKIIGCLEKESNNFLHKDLNDFYTDYEAVSKQIQAKYFLTRFHSNTAWDYNPVCIFRFRISAFILPGTAPAPEDTTGVNVTTDSVDGAKYRIDSIHFNSDICSNFEEFEDLMKGYYFDVNLA